MATSRRVTYNPTTTTSAQSHTPTGLTDPEDLYYDGSWPDEDGR